MTVRDLADAVGVTPRTVLNWQAGRSTPGDRSFGRLLRALRCDAQDLSGRPRGTETLADLRRDAGLSADDAATLVRARGTMGVDAATLRALERGGPLAAGEKLSPERAGELVRRLAKAYRIPERVVMDAWRRSRPGDLTPALPPRQQPRPSKMGLAAWQDLNSRQRLYLACIFLQKRTDASSRSAPACRGAEAGRRRGVMLALAAPPEVVGYTPLQERLRREGVHDPGAGSTVEALIRRGLLLAHRDLVIVAGAGEVRRTCVELTPRGRAAVHAGLGVRPDQRPPQPLLSPWLWQILVRVARAGSRGLDGSLAGRGPHVLAVGRRPGNNGVSRGFIELRHPEGVSAGPCYWFLTSSGGGHLRDYLETYRGLYPEVDTAGI
ncbi:helix-turn-helix domain-containing protein [Streptomyces yaizuensis]|uniref:Helix-turn-helix domain-containing protein n=2 Tax=Streptomyces yaizuensis TaxID=2989713 RepID=A0ABQ5NZ70_9ACTN|nr:helix-turn-helix domain-containing protein [Streptomyces sp. YSPA8]